LRKTITLSVLTASIAISLNTHSEVNNYERDLAGIWAMMPILSPVKGLANVTKYYQDGSYHLYSFKCTGSGKFSRERSHDSIGSWKIEENDIVTIPENSGELDQLSGMADDMRAKIDSLPQEKRTLFRNSLPQEMIDLIDGNSPEGRETILTLNSTIMKSKQDLGFGRSIHFDNRKVSEIKPLCEKF